MKLNLGCGNTRMPGFVGIDSRALENVDIVRDILRGLPFSDQSIEEIRSENFLEHLPQAEVIWAMNEMWRVMKSGGPASHLVPAANTTSDYQDPTHLSRWHEETLTYFTEGHHRNMYYGGAIKPWVLATSHRHEHNPSILLFTLVKP